MYGQRLQGLFLQAVPVMLWKVAEQFHERAVCPAKSDYILLIAHRHGTLRGSSDDVVFFPDGAIAAKVFEHGGKKLVRDAVSIIVEAVPPQTPDGEQFDRRPTIRIVPL